MNFQEEQVYALLKSIETGDAGPVASMGQKVIRTGLCPGGRERMTRLTDRVGMGIDRA